MAGFALRLGHRNLRLNAEFLPGVGIDVGLVEDASVRPCRNLMLSRHDGSIRALWRSLANLT